MNIQLLTSFAKSTLCGPSGVVASSVRTQKALSGVAPAAECPYPPEKGNVHGGCDLSPRIQQQVSHDGQSARHGRNH